MEQVAKIGGGRGGLSITVSDAIRTGLRVVGAVYRRTRPDENGIKRQRAEVRFDDVGGCLRTPLGDSSRQVNLGD